MIMLVSCTEESEVLSPSDVNPTPTALPTTVPAPQSQDAEAQLAYLDDEAQVWLVSADGSNRRRLLDPGNCPRGALKWSPSGDRLVCLVPEGGRMTLLSSDGRVLAAEESVGAVAWSPTARYLAYSVLGVRGVRYLIADTDGGVIREVEGVDGELVWSSDGKRLAYSSSAGTVTILDVDSGDHQELPPEIDRVLAWLPNSNRLVVATDSRVSASDTGVLYEAKRFDLDTRELLSMPILNNGVTFWIAPTGTTIATSAWPPDGAGKAPEIVFVDPQNGALTRVPESTIRYPGEWIPASHGMFSTDGTWFYWSDAGGSAVYRARATGGDLAKVTDLESISVEFSPDLQRVAYRIPGQPLGRPPVLWTARINGSERQEVGISRALSWRPRAGIVGTQAYSRR